MSSQLDEALRMCREAIRLYDADAREQREKGAKRSSTITVARHCLGAVEGCILRAAKEQPDYASVIRKLLDGEIPQNGKWYDTDYDGCAAGTGVPISVGEMAALSDANLDAPDDTLGPLPIAEPGV